MKAFTFIALIAALVIANVALAQGGGVVTVEPITSIGLEDAGSEGLGPFINNIYRYLIGIGAVLAVLVIMWGGFRYMTSEAIGQKSAGREEIQRAILGLILLLSPVIVFGIINSDITRFDFSFLSELRPEGGHGGGGGGSGSDEGGGGGSEDGSDASSCPIFDPGRTVIGTSRGDAVTIDPAILQGRNCCSAQSRCTYNREGFGREQVRHVCNCEEPLLTGYFWEGDVSVEFVDATTGQTRFLESLGPITMGPYDSVELCRAAISREPDIRAAFEISSYARNVNYSELLSVLISGLDIRANCEYEEREP